MGDSSKKRLLEYAAKRLGRAALAARLKVPEKMVADWIDEGAEMTNSKALALADLVQELNRETPK